MIRALKLFLVSTLLAGSVSLAGGALVSAQYDFFKDPCADNSKATVCKDNDPGQTGANNRLYGPEGIVTKVVGILAIIIGVAAVIVIIIAGIQYMLSTGDPTKVNNAKNAILYALIGLAIAVFSRTIVVFIISKL